MRFWLGAVRTLFGGCPASILAWNAFVFEELLEFYGLPAYVVVDLSRAGGGMVCSACFGGCSFAGSGRR